ncbi:prephenate dehydrogenase [Ktedonobacter sp. SOSP1-85]|uniref:prephenate dehydrogenase n=1 Tax=Ktedonobacter sp. SOSP1-85 TaxID=2778367 RepID=UPI0019156FB6|nr:prephenate dehydrogenase [Ktedonobacter sp. SOSP1-85]GHO73094.1 prephenate dehydrogenase [Ktedonobacter sp. SOSP1-85]
MFSRVAIVGLGLIGGSIGLALRRSKAAQEVAGYDLGKGVCQQARRVGAIDAAYESLEDTVRGADLVILATPVGAIRALLQALGPVLTPGTVITDVASTKAQVISWAEEFLPETVAFVGGHPMAGKEVTGVEAADADLFRNRVYCLTPTVRTRSGAINKVVALAEVLGARIRFLEPAEHDGQVATVSHLPFLASVALMETAGESASWRDASLLAASGFRDATRLAAGSPEMYRDICLTNRDAVSRGLDEYIAALQELRRLIVDHDTSIVEHFSEAQQMRLKWQATYEE